MRKTRNSLSRIQPCRPDQITDQLLLQDLPHDDFYGLSTSSFKKQTAQKLICNHLMKSTLERLLERLKEESDQAGPGSVEQLRYRMFLSNNNDTSGLWLSSRCYMKG